MSTTSGTVVCPLCATPRSGDERYCERDGYDFVESLIPPHMRSWEAVVMTDHELYERVEPDGVEFPSEPGRRVLAIDKDDVLIGRHSRSRGIEPDIDLAAAPGDPGVSHRHAHLVRGADGAYALVDLGSTNGTAMNGDRTPLPPDTPVTLTDGDRIHIGAWTTITIREVTDRSGA
jgi:hypothetical protein